jgi:hypothetical protein
MKTFLPLACIFALLIACQTEQRYFENSPEIETAKKIVQAHNEANYDYLHEVYADTAQFYYNSVEPMSLEEIIEQDKQGRMAFSESGFTDEVDYEMVITDEGNKWVGVWGVWKATLASTGQVFKQPVHVSARFADGKIVEEWAYWDNAPVMEAMMKQSAGEAGMGDEGAEGKSTKMDTSVQQ